MSNKSIFSDTERDYAKYCLSQLFEVGGCPNKRTSDQVLAMGSGKYPYVTTSASNNGISDVLGAYEVGGNVITIDSATVGSAFYQPLPFTGSDHVEVLKPLLINNKPLFILNEAIGLFICALLRLEMFRYGYGRKFNQVRIKSTQIPLPLKVGVTALCEGNSVDDIDWEYISSYTSDSLSACRKKISTAFNDIDF